MIITFIYGERYYETILEELKKYPSEKCKCSFCLCKYCGKPGLDCFYVVYDNINTCKIYDTYGLFIYHISEKCAIFYNNIPNNKIKNDIYPN